MAEENKFRFSCEYMDDELGLIYYNYRHLNPFDGRWIRRDPIKEQGGWNLYVFIKNVPSQTTDRRGTVSSSPLDPTFGYPPLYYPPSPGGWPQALNDLLSWLIGICPETTNYECDSEMSLSVKHAPIGQTLIKQFLEKNKGSCLVKRGMVVANVLSMSAQ